MITTANSSMFPAVRTFLTVLLPSVLVPLLIPVLADEPAAFRTDSDSDDSKPWFQLLEGQFPPAGSAHAFAGELYHQDHIERTFIVRADRTDAQNRSHFDLPVAAEMLPYGAIWYHGAPAALRDIPIGTHLHGLYYRYDETKEFQPLEIFNNRRSIEAEFTRCLLLEDDFSHSLRNNQLWRIDSVNLEEMKLITTQLTDGKPADSTTTFDLQQGTQVCQGRSIAELSALQPGQQVLLNLTWATLYGPGRVVQIWLDEPSRQLARQHQLDRHRDFIRQRGFPGKVVAVDNQQRIVTVTLFDIVDRDLYSELSAGDTAGIAVARDTLAMFDPVNDRKSGPILAVSEVPQQPGSSGIQVQIQPSLLLEGYRPGRIVRIFPSAWKVVALPREEEFFGR